jgi:tripartite-type tricarboxylate transporter receptor subunit TctC
MRRRQFLRIASAAASTGLLARVGPAKAQSFAGKQIRVIVPFPAGGPTDIVARPLAQMLGDALKATVVIDNRGGAGGSLGAEAVARSAPDGQILLVGTVGTHAINPALYPKLPYDAVRDFTPVALVALAPVAVVVHPSQPVSNLADLVALAKRMPGKLNYGSAGAGTPGHLTGEMFKTRSEINRKSFYGVKFW